MVGVVAASEMVPVYVPILGVVWGVLCWFIGLRRMVRDPRGEMRRIAEIRARSRLIHPFGGGDVDREFDWQWRLRWLWPVPIGGYVLGVSWLFVLAFSG